MPAGWLVPALQMGAALIGAKASGDAAKASQRGTDLKKLRKEAEAAGFNPLTVLRATGGQGFNKGSSGALASASFWSSFANSAGQIVRQFDPFERKRKELELVQRSASIADTIMNTRYIGKLASQVGNNKQDSTATLTTMPGFGDDAITTTTLEPTLPGLNLTLTEVFAKTPVVNTVKETAKGVNTNNRITAPLFPVSLPYSNKVINVPWNPEDADLGAIAGGVLQWGALSGIEMGKWLGQYADEARTRRQMNNAFKQQFK
jgi:hypothetical protein